MAKSSFHYVTYVRTTPEKLWKALTSAEMIRRYWFGMDAESEWKAGSRWKLSSEGTLMDSGEILEAVPARRLLIRWRNEWKPELKAEGDSRCTFELEPMGTAVRLTLTHSIEAADSRFIAAVSVGWPMVLANLKSLLETGDVAMDEHPGH